MKNRSSRKNVSKRKNGKIATFLIFLLTLLILSGCGKQESTGAEDVDVDLTKMGGNLLYAQVYNMVNEPDDFLGKSVRVTGYFSTFQEYDKKGQPLDLKLSCIVPDAQGCCATGMEFILEGENSWPEDYPEIGDEITVEGTFASYEMYGLNRCQLLEAHLR